MSKSTPQLNKNLKRLLLFLLLLAPLGLFLPFLNDFPYPAGSLYSDFTISHFPNTVYLANSVQQYGQLPLWSDQILSGYPFAANPLSGMWYPFSWLGVFVVQPAGINLVILLHLLAGGMGMYFLLEREGRSFAAALAGAYLFEFSPKLMAHFAAGHVSLIYAVCLTPWLLLAGKWDLGGRRRFSSGAVLGLMALADIRWAPIAGILWLGFCIKSMVDQKIFSWKTILKIGINLLVGIGTAAPLILPLLEYSGLSTRSLLTAGDNLTFSLPAARLLGLVLPDLRGYAEWALYPGMVAIILFLWAFTIKRFWKENWFWLAGLGITILFSLGDALPFSGILARLPGMNLLRVPSRALFLVSLFFSIFLAWGMDALAGLARREKTEKRPGNFLPSFGLVLFGAFICGGLWFLTGSVPVNFWLAFGTGILSLICIFLSAYGKIAPRTFSFLLTGVLVLELGLIANLSVDFRPADQVPGSKAELVNWLESQKTGAPFRIYSPSYSIPQELAAVHGLELADGIDPLQLVAYQRFMEQASGINNPGYSVTLPPFASGRPDVDNSGSVPDPGLLGLLNVRYIAAEYDLAQPEFTLVARFGETRVYENQSFKPRAWLEALGNQAAPQSAELKYWSPDRIEVNVAGPGKLVLSEIIYPGWKVAVDGEAGVIEPADGILRAVELAPGEHVVSFVFQPVLVWVGLALAILTWISIAIITHIFGVVWGWLSRPKATPKIGAG